MIGTWQLIIILAIVLFGILPTIIALVDVIRNDFRDNNKTLWVVVVLFGGLIGAMVYFSIGRKQRITVKSQ